MGRIIQQWMPEKSKCRSDSAKWCWSYEGKSSPSQGTGRSTERKSFSKKSSGILCKGDRLTAYRFIEKYHPVFGVRWLLKSLSIYQNAYYNYLKHRKSVYHARKSQIKDQIQSIYHEHGGVDGYRQMKVYLKRRNINLSALTVHRYMNKEMGLKSIVRRRKPGYTKGHPYKLFRNILEQDFTCDEINTK